jgi:RNA polymerase sigma-70 factor (ECF subfamily)
MTHHLDELRPGAFAIAYRMLGSVSDAEDIVQEALLRLHRAERDGAAIASRQAYLAAIVTRLAIDQLRSARVRRETYIGEWLPEPLVIADDDPAARTERMDSLGMAFLVLLESLSPEQRAVFLLRDVFDYGYDDIARILAKSEPAVRQLAVRARARVLERRPRFDVRPDQQQALADRFFDAVERGDLQGLETLLAADASLHGDGGGKAPALARPILGRELVARALVSWARAAVRAGGARIERTLVNGQPGAQLFTNEGALIAVWALDVVDDTVRAVHSVVNPDKLRHLGKVENLGDYLKRGSGTSPGAKAHG